MQDYLVKTLLGFFVMTITTSIVTSNSLDFLRALAQEADEEQAVFDAVEQTNSISDFNIKYPPTNKKNKDWVKVKLSGSTHSHVLSKGQNYELKCMADGGPAPQIYWIRGGDIERQIDDLKRPNSVYDDFTSSEIGPAKIESKYIIDCASKNDEGPIYCVAISGDKVEWDSTIILVNDNSTRNLPCGTRRLPVITNHASTVLALQGTSVVLPCVAVGKPKPFILWETAEGNRITNYIFNPRYKVLPTGDLLIDSLEWNDMNGYTCIARSNLGEDRASTFIYPVQRDDGR
ncbi:hypothetical protein HCN44_007651 [Aphidius gifuensis]|uniref:Ig-like domain-containing protein n=1 Tax=Aphidius gifuensis TaxID=684658 RepID=A0A835CLE0_APHGI|nr:neural/ectodermal development factor IMP-L2 [Aphidius gifuensis]KAF7988157.1 hypothetical protein HCN44_007651 [Aphidius gifuensis]